MTSGSESQGEVQGIPASIVVVSDYAASRSKCMNSGQQ
jgi:hypothetical protein